MMHILTLSDKNYIVNGMGLYDSISNQIESDFNLHYLAMDDYTETALKSLKIPNIIVYSLKDLERDEEYHHLKKNNESRPIDTSDGQSPFHWALGSFFSNFIMKEVSPEHVMYADSDIFFYRTPELITKSVGDKSIGLITHKHIQLDKTVRNPGYYNVGIVYFKNDEVGRDCLDWWSRCCVYPDNPISDIFGACGDQKYLELFGDMFGEENIKVLCPEVGNGAPWNFTMFDFLDDTRVVWKDPHHYVLEQDSIEQDLVFNHFSHINIDYDEQFFKYDRGGEWGPALRTHPGVTELYAHYTKEMIKTRDKYTLQDTNKPAFNRIKSQLGKSVELAPSEIHGDGLFAKEDIDSGVVIHVTHVDDSEGAQNPRAWICLTPNYKYNHSSEGANCEIVTEGNTKGLKTLRAIKKGAELFVDYTKDKELEQPLPQWNP